MPDISSPYGPIDLSKVKKISDLVSLGAVRKLSDSEVNAFRVQMEKVQEQMAYLKAHPEMADNHPSKLYAEIVKDGKVVARFTKADRPKPATPYSARLQSFFAMNITYCERAAMIAKTVGRAIRYT